jgi:short-subunit dehydrogenase
MTPSVVITGSTRGIGYSLAEEFLNHQCSVTISGRTQQGVDEAVKKLSAGHDKKLIHAQPCDVTEFSQVESLWQSAKKYHGYINIWINNAGSAVPMMKLWELSAEQYDRVVRTNVLGTMYGSKVALQGMLEQGHGALYNMEGFGARGRSMNGMAVYGSTKSSVHFINQSLADEAQGTPVITGALAPGMVITDMITEQFEGREEELEKSKRVLNIIAERAETVAPVLVDKILKNRKNGATIAYTSSSRIMMKFILAPFNKRDLFT